MNENISVTELDSLVESISVKQLEVDQARDKATALQNELTELKRKAIDTLTSLGREKYAAPFGTIYQAEVLSVSTPSDWEAKKAWIDYLKERGGDDMVRANITFNNATLKSFIKAEIKAREEAGDLNRNFPGVGEPKVFMDLRFRKA